MSLVDTNKAGTILLNYLFVHNNIDAEVQDIVKSDFILRYRINADVSVRVERIRSLTQEIALALRSPVPPIIMPLFSDGLIGIDVPIAKRAPVTDFDFQSLTQSQLELPIMCGYGTMGNTIIIDLVECPHLLVAGSSGSGKSVFLRSTITSLLCQGSSNVQLVLMDPKGVEFCKYTSNVKYMYTFCSRDKVLHNIGYSNNVDQVSNVLHYLVCIMEYRFKVLQTEGVSHWSQLKKKKPYIVVVIDEVADLLMMNTSKTIERYLILLGQKARAAGIHIVMATQRPSYEILSGILKVNFPSRVAFKVSSSSDSRVIIGTSGAEHLLGKGDGLIKYNNTIERIQGVYID